MVVLLREQPLAPSLAGAASFRRIAITHAFCVWTLGVRAELHSAAPWRSAQELQGIGEKRIRVYTNKHNGSVPPGGRLSVLDIYNPNPPFGTENHTCPFHHPDCGTLSVVLLSDRFPIATERLDGATE